MAQTATLTQSYFERNKGTKHRYIIKLGQVYYGIRNRAELQYK